MSAIDSGGPAYPSNRDMRHSPDWDYEPGMTLRDYFAANELARMEYAQCMVNDVSGAYDRLAKHCYRMADAMLKERAK